MAGKAPQRSDRLFKVLAVPLAVIILIVYILFFNGRPIYFTFGLLPSTLLKVNGQTESMASGRLLLSEIHEQYRDIFGDDIWSETTPDGVTMEEYAKGQVEQMLSRVAILNGEAKDQGIVLSDAEGSQASQAAIYYLSVTPAATKEALGLTEENMTEMFRQFAIANKYYKTVAGSAAASIEVSAEEARVIDILYIAADSQDSAEALLQKINDGQTFYAACQSFEGLSPEETELMRGMTESGFEDAAFALNTGENSGVVTAGGKYYIIHCVSDNEQSRTEANIARLKQEKILAAFNDSIADAVSSTYVEKNWLFWNRVEISSLPDPAVSFDDVYDKYFG